jgi:hypothetical protein
LKPEQWGSLLVQENNQGEKACDKRRIIIIIIIIIIIEDRHYTHNVTIRRVRAVTVAAEKQ